MRVRLIPILYPHGSVPLDTNPAMKLIRSTPMRCLISCVTVFTLASAATISYGDEKPIATWQKDIAPLLQKRCAGCHNANDREGRLSLESFADLQKGGKHGPSVQPGNVKSSRLLLMVSGQAKPFMPPEKDDRLSEKEIALLTSWIEGGAKGPDGKEPIRRSLIVPKINAPAGLPKPIASIALSSDGTTLAVARFAAVEIRKADTLDLIRRVEGFPGKVNSVEFSRDGKSIIAGTGISGLFGQTSILNVADGKLTKKIEGHRDALYAATVDPSGKLIATASYDRRIELREASSGKLVRTLEGHNGAIFDLAFNPDGSILASASADATIKLWHVESGTRLDTLGQPLKEQYVVRFSPDGRHVVGGGLDNRIRVWRVVVKDEPRINPLVYARIAHEGAIIQLGFTPDGSKLVSIADDQTTKLWETAGYTQLSALAGQSDVTPALAVAPDGRSFLVGRSDGTIERFALPEPMEVNAAESAPVAAVAIPARPTQDVQEKEPNDAPDKAETVSLPAKIKGVIHATADGATSDADVFRFSAKAGEHWVFETNAARAKSPIDTRIEVLDTEGKPIPRVQLQAVRDSYVTFRGINSDTRDCRVHNWEEMDLNQYLYLNGEVVKLWLWPRGPDSGFQFYPQRGNRVTFFDTTASSHPVHEPCYIVEAHPPGKKLIPNGLPVFPVFYENDDDAKRQLGSDSRLNFTVPRDGDYLVRITDVRSFHGADFKYELTARPSQPDFTVRVEGNNPSINAGNGKEFRVVADRKDGFNGEIRINIDGLPPGYNVSTPLVIESGQDIAYGTINSVSDAAAPTAENSKTSKLTATAVINGKEVAKDAGTLGEIKRADAAKILVAIGPDASSGAELTVPKFGAKNALELTIAPGETITAQVHIQRKGDFNGRIGFEAISHNLPHGIIVDNVGLSGLLIVEGTTHRQFFLTAAKWVPEQTRLFFLRSREEGGQTSWPILLHVRRK